MAKHEGDCRNYGTMQMKSDVRDTVGSRDEYGEKLSSEMSSQFNSQKHTARRGRSKKTRLATTLFELAQNPTHPE